MHCADCRFFESEQSECRFRAPELSGGTDQPKWPVVSSTDWCGSFELAESEKERQAA